MSSLDRRKEERLSVPLEKIIKARLVMKIHDSICSPNRIKMTKNQPPEVSQHDHSEDVDVVQSLPGTNFSKISWI